MVSKTINLISKYWSNVSTRQGFTVLADQAFGSLVTFFCNILVARANDITEYGVFFLGLSVVYLTSVIQRSLVSIPLQIISRPLTASDKANYLGSSLILHLAISLLLISIIICGGKIIFDKSSIYIIIGVSVASLGYNFREFIRATILAELKTITSLTMNGTSNAIIIIAYLIMYFYGKLTIFYALIILGVSSAIPALIYACACRQHFKIKDIQILNDCRQSWLYGRWIFGAVLANTGGIRAIPWLLLVFDGKVAVAVFGALTTVAGAINPLINGMANYITPKLANDAHDYGQANALAKGKRLFLFCLLIAFVYSIIMGLVGNGLIGFLYPDGYTGYAFAFAILAFEVGLKGTNLSLSGTLRAINRPQREFFSSFLGAFFALLLGVLLIPLIGITGAAIALLSSFIVVLLINWLGIWKIKSSTTI